jgi:hypothetical protein
MAPAAEIDAARRRFTIHDMSPSDGPFLYGLRERRSLTLFFPFTCAAGLARAQG